MNYSDYFDILPYGIFLISSNGIIIEVNQAASDILWTPPGLFH